MSPATSTQVRNRQKARKAIAARKQQLDEERRRRDEREIELATDFLLSDQEGDTARAAVEAAERAMGRVVDTLIGELGIRYPRAAQLLGKPEDELRRLRQLATSGHNRQTTNRPTAHTRRPRRGHRSQATAPTSADAVSLTDPDGERDSAAAITADVRPDLSAATQPR